MEPAAPAPEQEVHNIPRKLIYIEVSILVTAIFLLVLVCCGSFRRRCRNNMFKGIVWASYILCNNLITYTMGQMQSASFHKELFAIWASFLLIVLGSADSFSAFTVEDNERKASYNLQISVQSFWLGWLLGSYDNQVKIQILLWLLYIVMALKIRERSRTYMWASRSALARNTKQIIDFMDYYEHELSDQDDIGATEMKRSNYVVIGENKITEVVTPPLYQKRFEIKDEVITIQKILQCKGELLTATSDPHDRLKDICLSFALHKIICRRLAGYTLLECPLENAWSFVREWLFSKENDYERAFRVIEIELAFLFDLLYTKYPVIFEPRGLRKKIIELISIVLGVLVAISLLNNYKTPQAEVSLTVGTHNIDVLVTAIVLLAIVLLEFVQMVFIIFSDWAKVILLCKYVQKPSWQASKCIEKLIEFVCCAPGFQPWGRKISQYSLLRSFDHNPSRLIYNHLTSDFLDSPGNGRKESPPTKLPAEVKKAIILSLRKYKGRRLTNGEASLHQNGVLNELAWTCELETTTHIIMVWHIATSFCEESSPKSVPSNQRENFVVATSLSKYCAYLVALAPRFLPDNAYDTGFIFDQIVIETRDFFNGRRSMEEKKQKMKAESGDGDLGNSVVRKGAVLGNHLWGIENEELRWKILAEFWVEMMLFVTPSDDATIHAEYLAKGGEFVTHLWALLSHVGILKRDSIVPEI